MINMQKGEYEINPRTRAKTLIPNLNLNCLPKNSWSLGIFVKIYDWLYGWISKRLGFEHAKLSPEKNQNISLNYYQVDASLSLETCKKGWINSADRELVSNGIVVNYMVAD